MCDVDNNDKNRKKIICAMQVNIMDNVDLSGPIESLIERRKKFEKLLERKLNGDKQVTNTIGNIELIIQNYSVAIDMLNEGKRHL